MAKFERKAKAGTTQLPKVDDIVVHADPAHKNAEARVILGDHVDETIQADGTTELAVVGKENALEVSKVEALLQQFGQPFLEARQLAAGYAKLVVTDENDADGMKKARELRLQLRQVRINAENTRKQLKEDSLREGKAIDGMANIIKAIIVPAEQHLEQQEKYAENLAIERKATRKAERTQELSQYMDNVFIFNLEEMDDDQYAQVLEDAKKKHADKLAAEAAAKAELEAKEKADAEAAEQRRKKMAADLKKSQAAAKKAAEEKAEADAKAAAEKKRADDAQAELDAKNKKEADEAAAAEKAAQDAAKAPDKDKLNQLAQDILLFSNKAKADLVSNPASKLQDPNAVKIVDNVDGLLMKVAKYIKDNVEKI